ncbi:MAG: hypothetical protein JXC85_03655 [Candidatus Aenigmarchaeota archaeon]|nr:hypothetical protein [Candidatus Aenigmarchaeota archaeon]
MLAVPMPAEAAFECTIRHLDPACSGGAAENEIPIFRMWALSNAHAQTIAYNDYEYTVCCGGMGPGGLGMSCDSIDNHVLDLYSPTNSHVANPLTFTYTEYVCISSPIASMFCTVSPGSCPSNAPVGVASIFSDTNSHVGDYTAYGSKVCCGATESVPPTTIIVPDGSAWTNANVDFDLICDDGFGSGCMTTYWEFKASAASCDPNLPANYDNSGTPTLSASTAAVDGTIWINKVCFWSDDYSGNREAQVASNLFYIDMEDPTVGVTALSGFDTYFNGISYFIKGTGTISAPADDGLGSGIDGSSSEFTTDLASWNPASYSGGDCERSGISIVNGLSYTFNLRVRDNVENLGTGTPSVTYAGDTAAPTFTAPEIYAGNYYNNFFNGIPGPISIRSRPTDTGSGFDPSSCEYRITGSWNPASWDGTYCYVTGLSPGGDISVQFRGEDNLQNAGTSAIADFIYDDTGPAVDISGLSMPLAGSLTIQLTDITCDDGAGSGCDFGPPADTRMLLLYASDPGSCSNVYANYVLSPPQVLGSPGMWACAAALDHLGNPGFSSPADLQGPDAPVISSITHPTQTSWYSNNDPGFSWTASDDNGIAQYSYEFDQLPATVPDGTNLQPGNTISFTDISDGEWYIHVRAQDGLGNWGPTGHYRARIDVTPPSVDLFNPATRPWDLTDVTVTVSVSDATSGLKGYRYAFTNNVAKPSSWSSFSALSGNSDSFSETVSSDGEWYLHVEVNDSADNEVWAFSGPYQIDSIGPTIEWVKDLFWDALATDPDVAEIGDKDRVGAAWNATDWGPGPGIEQYHYQLRDSLMNVVAEGYISVAPPVKTELKKMYIIYPTNMSSELVEGETYIFRVRAQDSVFGWGGWTYSDGFLVGICFNKDCGVPCTIPGEGDGVCNGSGGCYVHDLYGLGVCPLGCGPPALSPGDERACYDYSGLTWPCGMFASLCGMSWQGATIAGDSHACTDSLSIDNCCGVAGCGSKSNTEITGSWLAYQPPALDYYGPNKPFTIALQGVNALLNPDVPVCTFIPLVDCSITRPDGSSLFVDQWINYKTTADTSLSYTPTSLDGEWNLIGCELRSNFGVNGGWVMMRDFNNYNFFVDTNDPEAWITAPPGTGPPGANVGLIFDVTWGSQDVPVGGVASGIDHFEFQYVDVTRYPLIGWENYIMNVPASQSYYTIDATADGPGPHTYCYRVRPVDNADNVGSWSCDPGPLASPDFSLCNCSTTDDDLPIISSVVTTPLYTNAYPAWFNVNWSGSDGSGIKCFFPQYKMINNRTGAVIRDWSNWTALNNVFNVPVWNGPASVINCTDLTSGIFIPNSVVGLDQENRTYYFRVAAADDVVGTSNMGNWGYSANGTWVDWTAPSVVDLAVTRSDTGEVVPDGWEIELGETATFSLNTYDYYTGVNESWIEIRVVSADTGAVIQDWSELSRCSGTFCQAVSSWNIEVNVSYRGVARDLAGNEYTTIDYLLLVRKPKFLIASTRDLFMPLGSYEYVNLRVSNLQDQYEYVNLEIQDDYMYSKFVALEDGELSLDQRSLNISLLPNEIRSLSVLVYTADVGDWVMTIYANSTLPGQENVTDMVQIKIKVVHPAEFSGLSLSAVVILFCLAVIAYFRFESGKARR